MTIGRVSAFIDGWWQTTWIQRIDLIPPIDFSRDVLASWPERLLVIRDAESGWTDLGNPNRVFETLARERIAPAWLDSIASVERPVAG